MLKNIVMLFFSQGINYIIPLILVPYLVRVLGPTSYGEFNLALSIILYGCLFVDFGFNLYTSGEIAKSSSKDKIRHLYTVTILSKLAIFIPVILIISFAVNEIDKFSNVKPIVFILMIQIFSSVLSTLWLYQGLEKIRVYSLVNVIFKIASVPFIFLFVKQENDLALLSYIQGLSFLFSSLFLIYLAKKEDIYFIRIGILDILSHLKNSYHIFIGTVSVSLYTMSTPIILGLVSTTYEVGQFSATDKIRGAFISIFLILSNVIYPRVNILKSSSEKAALSFIKKIALYQILVGAFLSIIIYSSAPFIVSHYLGEDYLSSIALLQLMSPMVVLIPLSVVLSNYILLCWGFKKYYIMVPIITCFAHFVYIVPLSNYYGAFGSGLSILITEILSFTLLLVFVYKSGLLKKIYES